MPSETPRQILTGRTPRTRNRWSLWLGSGFLLYLIYLPVTQNGVKAGLIGGVLFLVLLKSLVYARGIWVDNVISCWTWFYGALGICYILYGLILGAPGALFSSFVYVIYPVVYTIFIGAATEAQIWPQLLRVIPLATIAISVGTIEYVLWSAGFFPNSLFVDPGLVENITFYSGYVQMSHYSLSSLIFVVPFLMALLVICRDEEESLINRKVTWVAIILALAVTLLGGRRALVILSVLAPFAIYLFRSQLPGPIKARSRKRMKVALIVSSGILVISALLVLGFIGLNWTGLVAFLAGGFDFEFNPNAIPRTEQFFALLRGWWIHPVFGSGLGSFSPEVVRNNRLWEYELQYVLLLFQTGVVGLCLYASGIVWIYWKGIKIIRSGSTVGVYMVAVLAGTTCILVANSADPYLQTFGHLWMLFLPVGLINWHESELEYRVLEVRRDAMGARADLRMGQTA